MGPPGALSSDAVLRCTRSRKRAERRLGARPQRSTRWSADRRHALREGPWILGPLADAGATWWDERFPIDGLDKLEEVRARLEEGPTRLHRLGSVINLNGGRRWPPRPIRLLRARVLIGRATQLGECLRALCSAGIGGSRGAAGRGGRRTSARDWRGRSVRRLPSACDGAVSTARAAS